MWPGLFLSGLFIALTGILVLYIFTPLGLMMMIAGPIMLILGLILKEPPPITPSDPNKKFCSFCLAEIDKNLENCPYCGYPDNM